MLLEHHAIGTSLCEYSFDNRFGMEFIENTHKVL
jgi:hypothetical protein